MVAEPVSDFMAVEPQHMDARGLGLHIMHCHRELAALGGEAAARFQSIADRLADELND